MKLIAVDGKKYTREAARDAIRLSVGTGSPLQVLTQNGDFFKTFPVDYHGGERYPFLERDSTRSDLLGEIIRPKAGRPGKAKSTGD